MLVSGFFFIMKKELTPEVKQKILKRINNGQSKKMILWEFKIEEKELASIAREYNIYVRDKDEILFANKIASKKRT